MLQLIAGGVCAPKGFAANGVHCGIRKNKIKKDLALITSEVRCAAACVYTQNLVKGAPVLVLDDASSALDMATERRVLTSIKEHCPESTLVIAAHRVSSVLDCDEIIYLRDGEIIERGTAEELIAKNGAFAAVYHLQTSDGQLDDSSYGRAEL